MRFESEIADQDIHSGTALAVGARQCRRESRARAREQLAPPSICDSTERHRRRAGIAGKRLDAGAQLFRIDGKLRQGSNSKQAGAIGVRDHRAEAGKQIARLGRIHHIHVLDGERNALPHHFSGQLVAIQVGAIEDGAVAPLAARLAAQFAQLC